MNNIYFILLAMYFLYAAVYIKKPMWFRADLFLLSIVCAVVSVWFCIQGK